MKVLVITGLPGAGKSEAVKVAAEMGIPVHRMGALVKEEVLRRSFDVNRANMASVANSERKKHGPDIWARRTVQQINRQTTIEVIDGCRSLPEMECFRKELGTYMVVIAIHASPKTRWARISERGREDDPKSFEELITRDRQELEWGLGSVISMADIMIVNEGVKGALRGVMRNILIDIGAQLDYKPPNGTGPLKVQAAPGQSPPQQAAVPPPAPAIPPAAVPPPAKSATKPNSVNSHSNHPAPPPIPTPDETTFMDLEDEKE